MSVNNMTSIVIQVVGEPSNDLESFLVYLTSCVISILVIFFVLYIFKLIADIKNKV